MANASRTDLALRLVSEAARAVAPATSASYVRAEFFNPANLQEHFPVAWWMSSQAEPAFLDFLRKFFSWRRKGFLRALSTVRLTVVECGSA